MITKEQGKALYQEVKSVFDAYPKDLWGCKAFGEDGIVLIGSDLTKEKRAEIVKQLPFFACVVFLKGLSSEENRQDRGLVQIVMMYGGSFPGWSWALGAGDWKESIVDGIKELEVLKRIGVTKSDQ